MRRREIVDLLCIDRSVGMREASRALGVAAVVCGDRAPLHYGELESHTLCLSLQKAGSDRCGRGRYAESGNRAREVVRDSDGSNNVWEETLLKSSGLAWLLSCG